MKRAWLHTKRKVLGAKTCAQDCLVRTCTISHEHQLCPLCVGRELDSQRLPTLQSLRCWPHPHTNTTFLIQTMVETIQPWEQEPSMSFPSPTFSLRVLRSLLMPPDKIARDFHPQ